jgi:ABC-2 type transport system permease protein
MMRPYLHIIRTAAREDSANSKRLIGGIMVTIVRVSLIAAIYKVAYKHVGNVGLSYENAVWSIAIYFTFILNLGIRNIFKLVDTAVRTGAVEVGLIKPIDWRLSKICELIGKNGLEFIIQLIVLPAWLLIVVGAPDITHLSLASGAVFLLLTVLSIITASAMFMTVGLTAFWLNDSQPTYRIFDKLALIFGGGFVPIALLPHVVQLAVRYSPFGVYAAPTQLLNPHTIQVLVPTVISAVAWSAVLVGVCQFVWKRAMLRIEVNGG